MEGGGSILWARGFRPFFLLGSIYALVALGIWLAVLSGALPPLGWLGPSAWHAHEMLFGFLAATIAGFLLTAVPVWTGSAPVVGGGLRALVVLWVAGRLVFVLAGALPAWCLAVVDLPFLPALAVAIGRPVLAARQRQNYGFLALLAVLIAANALMHLEAGGWLARGSGSGARTGVFLVGLLVVLIGGRIAPTFTRNALRRAGLAGEVREPDLRDRVAVGSLLLVIAVDALLPRSSVSGVVALLAAFAQLVRMVGWQSHRTLRDPLLWSLHLGYAWVAIGLVCVALSDLAVLIPRTAGLHALAAGAFGTMILAVMTRVALGHTGRPLVAPRGMGLAYALASVGAALRVIGPVLDPEHGLAPLAAGAAVWGAGFALFLVVYFPILTRPRVDGAPG